jgi:hypothetical protein
MEWADNMGLKRGCCVEVMQEWPDFFSQREKKCLVQESWQGSPAEEVADFGESRRMDEDLLLKNQVPLTLHGRLLKGQVSPTTRQDS